MASGINIYSFFSDIRNNYSISIYLKKTILDIPKQVRILDIQKSYFGYQKQQFRISENKHLFQISKKLLWISEIFRISKITIFDIQNKCLFSDIRHCCFGYPK